MIEVLESRQLLSVSLDDGVLSIQGTNQGDVIVVARQGDTLFVYDNGVITPFADAEVEQIKVRGGNGHDLIVIGPKADCFDPVLQCTELCGGNGKDTIVGGSGKDLIDGGNGKDKLFGECGKDILKGENGPDKLLGGPDFDKLFGGRGPDFLFGGFGPDLTVGGPGPDTIIDLF